MEVTQPHDSLVRVTQGSSVTINFTYNMYNDSSMYASDFTWLKDGVRLDPSGAGWSFSHDGAGSSFKKKVAKLSDIGTYTLEIYDDSFSDVKNQKASASTTLLGKLSLHKKP